jgi:hypothetical protein
VEQTVSNSAQTWELEHYLTQSRKKIDRTFDYRYSVLTEVFGRLIRERLLRRNFRVSRKKSWSLSAPMPSFLPNSTTWCEI